MIDYVILFQLALLLPFFSHTALLSMLGNLFFGTLLTSYLVLVLERRGEGQTERGVNREMIKGQRETERGKTEKRW